MVCATCFKFLETIYDRKQLKKIKIIPKEQGHKTHCLCNYHNKLTDSFKT